MNLKIERDDRVVTVTLHRPHVHNALSSDLLTELLDSLRPLDRDPSVGCFVVTGSDRAFHALCATEDRAEGMRAFLEKRAPVFTRPA